METNFTYRPSPTALLNPCSDLIFKKLFTDNSEESRISLVSKTNRDRRNWTFPWNSKISKEIVYFF